MPESHQLGLTKRRSELPPGVRSHLEMIALEDVARSRATTRREKLYGQNLQGRHSEHEKST